MTAVVSEYPRSDELMFDVLGAALASLRITGATLLHDEYRPPWAVAVPSAADLASQLGLPAHRQAIAFHLVRKGAFSLTAPSSRRRVSAGEIAIVFGGVAHVMSDGAPVPPRPVAELMSRSPGRSKRLSQDGTRLVCGAFLVDDPRVHPLVRSLPPVLVARADGPDGSMVSNPVADLLVRELDRPGAGTNYAVARLVELLCLEVLRAHAATVSARPGFLKGLTDSAVSRAMARVLERPESDVSVPVLAKLAGLSPSRFAARFRTTVGVSPMAFAAQWRVDRAGRMLAETDWSVGEIAVRVGYDSPAAFSRAFSRATRESPIAWRRARRENAP